MQATPKDASPPNPLTLIDSAGKACLIRLLSMTEAQYTMLHKDLEQLSQAMAVAGSAALPKRFTIGTIDMSSVQMQFAVKCVQVLVALARLRESLTKDWAELAPDTALDDAVSEEEATWWKINDDLKNYRTALTSASVEAARTALAIAVPGAAGFRKLFQDIVDSATPLVQAGIRHTLFTFHIKVGMDISRFPNMFVPSDRVGSYVRFLFYLARLLRAPGSPRGVGDRTPIVHCEIHEAICITKR